MADYPLRSATDRRLGEPLPHQQANQTQAHPIPINLWHSYHATRLFHQVLIPVSRGYPCVWGRLPTRYSPVRRFPLLLLTEVSIRSFSLDLHVLSTPPAFILSQDQTLNESLLLRMSFADIPEILGFVWFFSSDTLALQKSFQTKRMMLHSFLLKELSVFLHYIVFNVLPPWMPSFSVLPAVSLSASFYRLPSLSHSVNTFFQFFPLNFKKVIN